MNDTPSPRPLYELRFGPLVVGSNRVVDPDGTEVSTVTDQWDEPGVRYEPVVEEVWHLHGIDYEYEWPDCHVPAYGKNIPKDDIAAAQEWASQLISEVSEYRVKSWTGLAPLLIEFRHELVFEMTSGRTVRIDVGEHEAVRITNAFNTPSAYDMNLSGGFGGQVPAARDTVTHRRPRDEDGPIEIVRINLNHVGVINETIRVRRIVRSV